MSATGLEVFDKTLQTTHIWLDELMQDESIGPDRQVAWHVLGVVLRAVRDRIPLELAVHLGSQLLVRGLYYDQWHAPGRMDEKPRSLDAFLAPIGERLNQIRPMDARVATGAVFTVLARHVDPGQAEKVRQALPGEVQTLWPAAHTWVEVERDRAEGSDVAASG